MLVRKFLPWGRKPYRKSLKNPAKTLPEPLKRKIEPYKKQNKTPAEVLLDQQKTPAEELSGR